MGFYMETPHHGHMGSSWAHSNWSRVLPFPFLSLSSLLPHFFPIYSGTNLRGCTQPPGLYIFISIVSLASVLCFVSFALVRSWVLLIIFYDFFFFFQFIIRSSCCSPPVGGWLGREKA